MDKPIRADGEPSMVFRGRLMYWHLDLVNAPPYEELSPGDRDKWTMLASGMERLMEEAPRRDP